MKGVVVKSTGSWYAVRNQDGEIFSCRMKGVMRLKGSRQTNPVAVGDEVDFELEPGRAEGVINKLHERRNYIIRKSNNLSRQSQVIAANLDQVMLMATLVSPPTSTGFIDRFLVTAEAYHIPAILLFNKTDLYIPEMIELLDELILMYGQIGYTCIKTSALRQEGIETVREKLQGNTTLISGHSGVGKSTLLNTLSPGLEQKTGRISAYSDKGIHTTTFAEMFELGKNTFVIDTPGIKDFGVIDMEQAEISHYFPEMRSRLNNCRFNNCRHLTEPGCAILEALENGDISESRYRSYLSLMLGEDIHH